MTNIHVVADPVVLPTSIDASAASTTGVHQQVRELGIPKEAMSEVLTVPPGSTLFLSTEPEYDSALNPRLLMTNSLEEYKGWIGCQMNPLSTKAIGRCPRH